MPGLPRAVNVTKQSPTMLVLSVEAPEENGGVDLTGYRVEYREILVTEFAIGRCHYRNIEVNEHVGHVVLTDDVSYSIKLITIVGKHKTIEL